MDAINDYNNSSKSDDRQCGAATSKSTTAIFPSGMVPNWDTKILKASLHSTQDREPRNPLRGLADDDAYAERPDIQSHGGTLIRMM